MNDEARFRSAHDVVLFALRRRNSLQSTPMSRLVPGATLGRGSGLHGYAGAAQAGMIRRLIGELPAGQAAALTVRFGVVDAPCPECGIEGPDAEWRAAAAVVATWPELAGLPPVVARAAVGAAARVRPSATAAMAEAAGLGVRVMQGKLKALRDRLALPFPHKYQPTPASHSA